MTRLKHLHDTRSAVPDDNLELHDLMEAIADFLWPIAQSDDPDPALRDDDPTTLGMVEHGLFDIVEEVTSKGMYEEGLVRTILCYLTSRPSYDRI